MRIYQESFTKMQEIVNDYTAQTTDFEIEQRVAEIIAKVRENGGDEALKTYEEKFDHVKLAEFAVPKEKMVKALAEISPELKQALLLAKKNIISYHKRELEYGFIDTDVPGITRGQKVTPLQRVGLYVPGGTAAIHLQF